ncbi:MAG: hypothetical protein LBT13_10605 [Treponema sp.]|nr:hypothetical protein [Treponema sp.]
MSKKNGFFLVLWIGIAVLPLVAQTYVSVPVDAPVYHILEQAALRGLCGPLPAVKPYSSAFVLSIIDEILNTEETRRFGTLSEKEILILKSVRKQYSKPEEGLDWGRGAYYFENNDQIHLSADIGMQYESIFSGSLQNSEGMLGMDNWIKAFINGDIGAHFSYNFNIAGGVLRSPRRQLGTYWTYYEGYTDSENPDINEKITVYSEPLASFPYSYKKRWDGFVWGLGDVSNSGQLPWPDDISIGYTTMPELGGSLLGGHITYRAGRIDREWGAMSKGSSLTLNQSAQPFLALEATATPLSWLSFSSLTGVLEYYNAKGIKVSANTNQNAFSITQAEINYKNYIHLDFGSTVVWPKRFELGYLFPLMDNFLYQDNIGDFDNMAMFFNLKGQYPGIASAWLSFFLDEINPEKNIFELDKAMYAFQVGTNVFIPWLPFTSVSLRYTKIEPYCYTHTRENVPWYGDTLMETSYTNNGRSLGYYLPPNSDELLFRIETLPEAYTAGHLQYQMIRHGADYGESAVDGSSFLSELGGNRSTDPVLRKYFLRDGAYQWLHIVKLGAEHTFSIKNSMPFQLFGEAGVVFSYFTNIDGKANSGSASEYKVIDTEMYPKSTTFIATIGIRVFPK